MVEFRADLHCHTTCSDGSDPPADLLRKAKAVSLQGLSITDHDTVAAYTPELFSLAEELSLRLLPGVEVSSELDEAPVHILGYGYDLGSSSFASFLSEIRKRRAERNRAILNKLAEKKLLIEEEELYQLNASTAGRPHIASLLVKKGYVGSIQEAFDRYLKDGAPCYATGFKCTPDEAIGAIQKAGGKAVLAHPHFYKKGRFLKQVLAYPFDGIECYYASLPKERELPWLAVAKERGWIATGGSDYHGFFKNIPLGASWVGERVFHALLGWE